MNTRGFGTSNAGWKFENGKMQDPITGCVVIVSFPATPTQFGNEATQCNVAIV